MTSNDYLNGKRGITFTLGFKFDGYRVYEDLATSDNPEMRDLAELFVYQDPKIYPFPDETLVRIGNSSHFLQ